jgi:hypothetical protein
VVGEVTDTLGGSIGSMEYREYYVHGGTPGTSSRATSATAFIGTTAAATAFFCPHSALICIKSDLVPWVWRACHYSAIFLIRPFFAPC